jgi:hypothetical protein
VAVSDSEIEKTRQRTDRLTSMVIRHVQAEMTGRPVDQVYRVLNARLHAADVPLDRVQVQEHAEAISEGTWSPGPS